MIHIKEPYSTQFFLQNIFGASRYWRFLLVYSTAYTATASDLSSQVCFSLYVGFSFLHSCSGLSSWSLTFSFTSFFFSSEQKYSYFLRYFTFFYHLFFCSLTKLPVHNFVSVCAASFSSLSTSFLRAWRPDATHRSIERNRELLLSIPGATLVVGRRDKLASRNGHSWWKMVTPKTFRSSNFQSRSCGLYLGFPMSVRLVC